MADEAVPKGPENDDVEGAASAFEALRKAIDKCGTATEGELKLIRQGVEALFDQVEALQARPDLAQDMAELKQTTLTLAERLKAMESMPTLKGGVQAFERAGADLLRASVKTLEQKAQRFDSAAFTFERITRNVQDRQKRWRNMVHAGGMGLVGGIFLVLFGPRLLPLDVKTQVAAAVAGTSQWEVGAALMQAERPGGLGSDRARPQTERKEQPGPESVPEQTGPVIGRPCCNSCTLSANSIYKVNIARGKTFTLLRTYGIAVMHFQGGGDVEAS